MTAKRGWRLAPAIIVLLLALPGQAAPAAAQDLGQTCRDSGVSPTACLGFEKLGERAAAECRRAGLDADGKCALPLGRLVNQAAVAAHEQTWTHRALGMQYELGNTLPFKSAPWVGTHNSFNSTAESPTLSHTDSNQQLSIPDQLRIDVRSVELDVHWFPSTRGEPRAPVVCHATDDHAGCTNERLLSDHLREIADWLDRHRDQVLLLYLEDDINDDSSSPADARDGHAAVAQDLTEQLGSRLPRLLYRPRAGAECEALPLGLTRNDVRAAGAQVVVVSGCDAGWRDAVFNWDPSQVERRPDDYRDFSTCDQDPDGDGNPAISREEYESLMVRYYEDSTFVTSATAPTGASSRDDGITAETAARMARCGVDLFGFDQLLPTDGRLDAIVWSWAVDEPFAGAGDCAAQRADGRWHARPCGERRPPACKNAGGWFAASKAVPFGAARARCAAEGGSFALPRTGYENSLLHDARADGEVWLAHRRVDGRWVATD